MTTDRTQVEIVQNILGSLLANIRDGWKELVVTYHVDEAQSESQCSYIIDVDGKATETFLRPAANFDSLMRELRHHLSHAGQEAFSKCRLHFFADGRFDAKYEYGAVDWRALLRASIPNFKSREAYDWSDASLSPFSGVAKRP